MEGSTIDMEYFDNGLFNFVARPCQYWKELSMSAEICLLVYRRSESVASLTFQSERKVSGTILY